MSSARRIRATLYAVGGHVLKAVALAVFMPICARFISSLATLTLTSALTLATAAAATPEPGGATPANPETTAKPAATAKAATAAKPAKSGKVAKTPKPPKNPPIVLYHVNHKETLSLRLRDGQGKPVKGMQKRFDKFLRCHHTNAKHAMHPRLMRVIYQTGRHWPGKKVEVVSGFRNPKVAKNPRSPHMKGLACDFRVEGVKAADLRDYLRKAYDKVGVGYYPNSTFVHVDVRKDRSAFWIDYSGPGERAVYSENPNEDLKTGRADQYHPTKIDESWVDDTSIDGKGAGAQAAELGANKPAETATP
jgi:uncharacterized protein YcbK (DUF882 family)